MASLWEKVKKNLADWYSVAYEKTDELTKIAKKKFEIAGINRTIEKHMLELGGRVYDLVTVQGKAQEIADDEKVASLIEEIKKLEEQLKLKEEEIESIKKDRRETGEEHKEEAEKT